MNVVDRGSYCIVNINNQLYRYDYTGGYNANNITEEVIRNQGTTVKPGEVLQMRMVDENEFAELGFDPNDDGLDEGGNRTTAQNAAVDEVDYNNWLVNNGLSGIAKLSAESKLEDIQAYYEQIANKLAAVMSGIDQALQSKDPDTIDAYMTELTYNMAALEGLSQQSGMGSMMSADMANAGFWGSLGVATVSGIAVEAGLTTGLITVAGASVSVPVAGWIVAGVCLATAIGIGIYNNYKQGQIDDLKEQMQQTMDDCAAKLEYAQKEIGETVSDTVSEVENALRNLEEADFSDISDMNGVFANINGVLIFQASIERWAEICEKYGVPFEGQDLLDKLGRGDDKEKYANEYIEKFVEHTKNAIETSGNVVDDTGSYIASADEINALISMLFDSEMTRQVNTAPLSELIQFIQERNQQDVYDDAGAIGDGMYTGGGDYDLGGYSGAYDTAGETQTGVDGAAQNGQYDVDTSKYTEVQKEAQEAAQKDIDDYLAGLEISGKSVEELEELYNKTKADLEDFSQYKENLELDLSGFDTAFSNIRKEQQARVDEYIKSVSYSGKSISELEQLYTDVSAQGEAFKKASSEVDISAFDGVLSGIRSEQQSIVDKKADEISSKFQSASSLTQLTSFISEAEQYMNSVSGYSVSTGRLSAISDLAKEKIQAMADVKVVEYETKAAAVKTSEECMTLAETINVEIAQFQGTGADTSGLQKVVADLITKANLFRVEEERKRAEEEAKNTSSTTPDTTVVTTSGDTSPAEPDTTKSTPDEGTTEGGEPAGDGDTTVTPPVTDDGETPVTPPVTGEGETLPDGETGENVDNTGLVDGKDPVPSTGEEGADDESTDEILPEGGDTEEPETNGGLTSGEDTEPTAGTTDDGDPVTPPVTDEGDTTEIPPATDEDETPPPATSDTDDGDESIDANKTTTTETLPGSSGITSVGQADETTPPPKTDDTGDDEINQVIEDALEEGKTPEEIADLIEIEVEE